MLKTTKQPKYPLWLRIVLPLVLVAVWLGVSAVGGPTFGKISEVSEVDIAAFLPDSAESTKLKNEIDGFISKDTVVSLAVFEKQSGTITDQETRSLENAVQQARKVHGVATESPSKLVLSEDKKAALAPISLKKASDMGEIVAAVREALKQHTTDGISHHVTGPAGFSADLNVAFSGIDGMLLIVALAVVFVILIVVYRSPVLPFLVLMTSLAALTVAVLVVFNLAKADVLTINGQVQGILFILVIGAATDYSLLYVSRYREELYQHASKITATINSLKGSLEPILASGGTVIAGLLCLLLSDLASNQALGPVGAIGVVMAMLASFTLLPSVLLLLGRAAFWPVVPHANKQERAEHKADVEKRGLWPSVGKFVQSHPRKIWIITAAVLGLMSIGLVDLQANGVPQSELISSYSEAREGQQIVAKHFSGGSGAPVLVRVSESRASDVVKALEQDSAIEYVMTTANNEQGVKPVGKKEAEIRQEIRAQVTKKIEAQETQIKQQLGLLAAQYGTEVAQTKQQELQAQLPSVDELVGKAYPFSGVAQKVVGGEVLLQATLTVEPDSEDAKQAIPRLRDKIHAIEAGALVGGMTAFEYDANEAAIHDRAIIIPAILLAITIILMVLLRSILAPVLLLLTTVVSFGAALGVSALVFNYILGVPDADPSVVLYGFVFLVALGIDYNIFLMTRVREEAKKLGTRKGVIKGLVVTGGVITSAGIVLAATFAALAVIPVVFLLQLAFIVAFGVLLDTIVVRSLLVPALIKDIGPRVWWPNKTMEKK